MCEGENMKDALKEFFSKLPENPVSLLILLGAILVVIGAAGGITYKSILPFTAPWAQFAVGGLGFVLAMLGVLFVWGGSRSAKPYGIVITHPRPGEHVRRVNVSGNIRKLPPEEYKLWVLRVYDDGRIAPLREVTIDKNDQTWVAPNCDVGGRPDQRRFLAAALIGKCGQTFFKYYFEAATHHNKWMDDLDVPRDTEGRYLPAISTPPPDIIECHRVEVVRDQSPI